jgi:hypothetical protein
MKFLGKDDGLEASSEESISQGNKRQSILRTKRRRTLGITKKVTRQLKSTGKWKVSAG